MKTKTTTTEKLIITARRIGYRCAVNKLTKQEIEIGRPIMAAAHEEGMQAVQDLCFGFDIPRKGKRREAIFQGYSDGFHLGIKARREGVERSW